MQAFLLFLPLLLFMGILWFLAEVFAYKITKTLWRESVLKWYFWVHVFLYLSMLVCYGLFKSEQMTRSTFLNLSMVLLAWIFMKMALIPFGLIIMGLDFFQKKSIDVSYDNKRRWLSKMGLMAMGIPIIGFLFAITKGKYLYKVHKVVLYFRDLPSEFDGFTITQLSDIHCDSFDDVQQVKKGVAMANALQSDVLLFTGDMVNILAEEMDPWIDVFKPLQATMGKFAILGNHDYADYHTWETPEAQANNMVSFKQKIESMGFQLLKNQTIVLQKNSQKLYIAGCENWGDAPFPQKGDIDATLNNVPSDGFVIMMSHDPTHFMKKIAEHPRFIPLTLSGHTHGMQLGIEIPGYVRWSPVKYRYPYWAGLYEQNKRKLYVNRGFGYLGFQGRFGIWPEITQITLRQSRE